MSLTREEILERIEKMEKAAALRERAFFKELDTQAMRADRRDEGFYQMVEALRREKAWTYRLGVIALAVVIAALIVVGKPA